MSYTPVPYGTVTGSGLVSLADTNAHQVASNAAREVWITADPGNAGTVWVGTDNSVTSTGGGTAFIKLAAGSTMVAQVKNSNLFWVCASGATQKYAVAAFDA